MFTENLIACVEEFKFLGVTIGSKLSLENRLRSIRKKANYKSYIIWCSRAFFRLILDLPFSNYSLCLILRTAPLLFHLTY